MAPSSEVIATHTDRSEHEKYTGLYRHVILSPVLGCSITRSYREKVTTTHSLELVSHIREMSGSVSQQHCLKRCSSVFNAHLFDWFCSIWMQQHVVVFFFLPNINVHFEEYWFRTVLLSHTQSLIKVTMCVADRQRGGSGGLLILCLIIRVVVERRKWFLCLSNFFT